MTKLMKTKWYAQPHRQWLRFKLSAQVNNKQSTIIPHCFYDEGLGAASAQETNPRHANFASVSSTNCFPESDVDIVFASLTFTLTKQALETDKITALRIGFMPIFCSFEDYTAIDELSSLEIQDILELQFETTDNQGFPLFAGVKLTEAFSGSGTFSALQPGLTTTQVIENVAFSAINYYDMLQYQTNSGKLKVCQGGLKWLTLTRQRPVAEVKIKIRPKSKRMVEKNFFGTLITLPQGNDLFQIIPLTDMSAVDHVSVNTKTTFNEWNQNFNFARV